MTFYEINFDGIVGPTHHYAGLSFGNMASLKNQTSVSNPRQAALQGLAKMKRLMDLGLKQAALPPHDRPHLSTLRRLGFCGNDANVIAKAWQQAPEILDACSSSSFMWTANAATMAPSLDTIDGKVHFTAANLVNKFHRTIEADQTSLAFKKIFHDEKYFTHHEPLTAHEFFGDEGAANHTRLCPQHSHSGLHLFAYGWSAFDKKKKKPTKFPARQSLEASLAVSRKHGIKNGQALFLQQNPAVIDAGVFHNDVIAVGNEGFFFCHEKAFLNQKSVLNDLKKTYRSLFKSDLVIVEIKEKDVPVKDAVASYLFNTQIVTRPDKTMQVIAPTECQSHPKVKKTLDRLIADKKNPVSHVEFLDLKQSMKNGGGPACLRLRVVLSDQEMAAMNPCVLLNDHRHRQLCDWVNKHYRDRFSTKDLADPKLLIETRTALDELTRILNLKNLYPFQL